MPDKAVGSMASVRAEGMPEQSPAPSCADGGTSQGLEAPSPAPSCVQALDAEQADLADPQVKRARGRALRYYGDKPNVNIGMGSDANYLW